MNAINTSLSYF